MAVPASAMPPAALGATAADQPYRPGRYLPALDGLRAIAIVAVLVYHNDLLLLGGYLGVDVFFVLSGFLITSLLHKEWVERGKIDFRRFYLRRVLRLFPALAALLLVATAFALLFPRASQSPHLLKGAGYSVLYVTNWVNARDAFALGPLGHTWSLAVEEQFYLAWPVLLVLLLRRFGAGRALAAVIAGLAVAAALWRLGLAVTGSTPWRLYNGTDTRADSLLLGSALAVALAQHPAWIPGRRVLLAAAAAGVALLSWLMVSAPLEWPAYGYGMFLAVAVASAAIVAAVLVSPASLPARLLSAAPMVWVGRLSYSLYLWHLPIYGFVKADRLGISPWTARILRLVLSLIAAVACHYLIERPFLRLKNRRAATPSQAPAPLPAPLP